MERRLIAGLIVIGLAIGIWLVWPRGDAPGATSTSAIAMGSSTTSSTVPAGPPTIAPDPSTTTTSVTGDVVETVEEAEVILRELWFGWFEGIYNQDEDRIQEVVATEHQVDLAKNQFGEMSFEREPTPDDLSYSETKLLRSTENCLVISTTAEMSGFVEGTTSDVHVLRWTDEGWRFFSLWQFEEDLWQNDCDALLSS